MVAFSGNCTSPLAVVPFSLTLTRQPFSTRRKVTALHMRSEEPKLPKLGRKLDSVKLSGAALEVLLLVVLTIPSVKLRPFSGHADPQ